LNSIFRKAPIFSCNRKTINYFLRESPLPPLLLVKMVAWKFTSITILPICHKFWNSWKSTQLHFNFSSLRISSKSQYIDLWSKYWPLISPSSPTHLFFKSSNLLIYLILGHCMQSWLRLVYF
jgi:hypothetical protein